MSHKRKTEEKRRLRRLYDETKNSYGAGAYFDERKNRYVRYSVSGRGGRAKYLRMVGNRKVRRAKKTSDHGGYRKVFDYWWELT